MSYPGIGSPDTRKRAIPLTLIACLLAGVFLVGGPASGATPAKVFRGGLRRGHHADASSRSPSTAGLQDRQATAVHDRLHARCLVLDDGKTRLAFVVCDSCMIPREVFDAAKRLASKATGHPRGPMLMSATHTHSAPTAVGRLPERARPDDYQQVPRRPDRRGHPTGRRQPGARADRLGGRRASPTQVFNRRWHMKPGTMALDPFGERRQGAR